ncbi:MAG TPA: glycosyltransferase, partial [Phycisphaerae bacterium]|nr:glycosyltransferase [Phycisphaerae bacterium]
MSNRGRHVLRVVHFIHGDEVGGVLSSVVNLAGNLDRSRFETSYLACIDGPTTDALDQAGVPGRALGIPMRGGKGEGEPLSRAAGGLRGLARWAGRLHPALMRTLRRLRPDIVHAYRVKAGLMCGPTCRLAGVPTIWHLLDTPKPLSWRRWRDGLALVTATWWADQIIAISASVRQQLPCSARRRTEVIHNGMDLQRIAREQVPRSFWDHFGIPPAAPLVGLVSRIVPRKGLGFFLDVAGRVLQRRPDARFVIVGDPGPGQEAYADRLHEQAGQLGLAHAVVFT